MKLAPFSALGFLAPFLACGSEYHVALSGSDSNPGTSAKPFHTISAAAWRAQPGDIITVHAGIYREWVNPPRGGISDRRRTVYQAAPGEKVEIKGSEVVKAWEIVSNGVWKASLPNSFFGDFNPFTNVIHGDWFWSRKGRVDHTAAVYLNGNWLVEATSLQDLFDPKAPVRTELPDALLWFAQVDGHTTQIFGHFGAANPNEQTIEVNVRPAVFFPDKTNINFITVRGFILRDAATPWAPPTAKQVGLIGTHWSRGWIIESNIISHSACSGIALGKYGDEWDNVAATAEAYVNTLNRALSNGWSSAHVGHHVVRGNEISHCEQAGIVGSLGAVFSRIERNNIHDIHVRRLFGGAEMAGIKIHGAIDVEILHNHIARTVRGLWLDWMAQGTHVSGNLMHDNLHQDVFLEVDHGPFLFDNNLLLSATSLGIQSQGGAFVHNLFAGAVVLSPADKRMTPFHKPHSTTVAGYHDNPHGDMRFYNNIFVERANLTGYDAAALPVWMNGNVFVGGAVPSKHETAPVSFADFNPNLRLVPSQSAQGSHIIALAMNLPSAWRAGHPRKLVSSSLLGSALISKERFESPDGTALRLARDYFGHKRPARNPAPGPFELPSGSTNLNLPVWP